MLVVLISRKQFCCHGDILILNFVQIEKGELSMLLLFPFCAMLLWQQHDLSFVSGRAEFYVCA